MDLSVCGSIPQEFLGIFFKSLRSIQDIFFKNNYKNFSVIDSNK